MADGTRQHGFNFPRKALVSALRPGEIVIDLFAGGGGASEALKQALGRDPDLAYNHDKLAVGMHAANHPFTIHKREDIWVADPCREVGLRPVGWFHASPDCTHFSQAKGGQPRSRATRSLSWVVLKWAGKLKRTGNAPRIISLENVEQILKWGPLIAKRCKVTGRVLKLDGTVAAAGERVPVWNQQLVPDKRYAGRTWLQFVAALRALGYAVEWRKLVASDYGAGTSRKRLFMVARNDVATIPWPAPTHGKVPGLLPLVTAADCIDWSVPCPSIFTRKKELAPATMRRIAKGLKRYVIDANEPFIVPLTHHGERRQHPASEPLPTITGANRGELAAVSPTLVPFVTEHANGSAQRNFAADEPMRTQCATVKGGHFAVVAPTLVQAAHGEGKHDGIQRWGSGCNTVESTLGTITASGGHAVAAATLVQTGYGEREGQAPRSLDIEKPIGTVVGGGVKHAIAAAHLVKFRGDSQGSSAAAPMPTITSGAGASRPAGAAHAMGVMTAFLEQANGGYYNGAGNDLRDPAPTICGTGSQQRLVTAHMAKLRGTSSAADAAEPLHTVSAGGEHHAVVECTLSEQYEAGALRVAAFLIKYYGTAHGVDLTEPLDAITTRDRLALVTVVIQGTPYVIVDIGLRMLRREELFRAQGFPPDYIIDRTADGKPLSISASVRMVGNSVSPPPLFAIARANLDYAETSERIAA
ncbi:DNA cytosine methyltransferase [Rhodanobacter sp. BL-MT-08]